MTNKIFTMLLRFNIGRKLAAAILLIISLAISYRTAQASILYTGAANQVVYVDQTFVVEWLLDTQDKNINTLSLNLTYSNDKLEVVDLSAGNSALDLWIKTPEFNQSTGEIKLIGGLSGGVKSNKLNIFRATFRPTKTGDAKISMKPDSAALIGDGAGTADSLIFNEVNFRINPAESKPAVITSPTHQDQDAWYKNNNVTFLVELKEGEQYSYSFSANLDLIPDPNPDDVTKPIHFKDLPDGIYYFKLNSKNGPSEWQEAGVYRVQIDTTPPDDFHSAVAKDPSIFDGHPFVSFTATDSVSGISHYEVKSGLLGGWKRTEDSYFELPGLVLGDKIEVKVVDAAGNERVTEIQVDKTMVNSVFSNGIFWTIIVLSLFVVGWVVRSYFKLLKKYKVNDK